MSGSKHSPPISKINKDAHLRCSLENLKKFLWEQVFLGCFYARQQLLNRDGADLYAKMQLLDGIGDATLSSAIAHKINAGMGSNDIISYLANEKKTTDNHPLVDPAASCLSIIENKHIAFKGGTRYPYSIQTMHRLIKKPIETFQNLIRLEIVLGKLTDPLPEVLQKIGIPSVQRESKETRLMREENKLAEAACKYANEFLATLIPQLEERDPLSNLVQISNENGLITLSISRHSLTSFVDVVGLDSVVGSIRSKLKISLSDASSDKSSTSDCDKPSPSDISFTEILENLGSWYEQCHTGVLKRLDQVPRLIASVLYFDLRFALQNRAFSLYDKYFDNLEFRHRFGEYKVKRDSTKLQLCITYLLDYHLYHVSSPQNDLSDPNGDVHKTEDLSEELKRYFNSEKKADGSYYPPLEKWVNPNESPMKERFKKTLDIRNLSKIDSSNLVSKQKMDSREASCYPVGMIQPPLWFTERVSD